MTKTVWAPAKINLYLEVCGRRSDGYHELGMVMQRVDLYDRLEISLGGDPGVRVVCPGIALGEGEENIAARAARSLLDRAGEERGVAIRIEKKIPVAAGLGGGSSDAAAVLLALDDMLGLGLGRQALAAEAVRLGADVPFFLYPRGAAWATGIGDRLRPFEIGPAPWYVLVNPGVAVSTAWVYGNLGLTGPGGEARMPGFPKTGEALVRLLRNDLERVTVGRYPLVGEIGERLLSLGAEGAMMSGSGPTVFGVFFEEQAARRAADVLALEPGWRTFTVRPL